MSEEPVTTLKRWRDAGADYRVVHLSDDVAVVDLCTCEGQPMERLESTDRPLIDYLREHSAD